MVEPAGVEPATSCLQSRRSASELRPRRVFSFYYSSKSQLLSLDAEQRNADASASLLAPSGGGFLKKEVIQPLVPQRLPCYDFIPVAELALGACPLAVGTATSGEVSSHDVTGGVYKARERIQGAVADAPLLAIPTSCSRVAGCNPNWGRFWGFASPRGQAAFCTGHCSTFAALGVRAIRT